jgi:hypothetical protein
MKISDEAVEAAAKVLAPSIFREHTYVDPEPMRDMHRSEARAALEAAVPYLMPDREALADDVRELQEYCEEQAEGPVVNDLGEGKLIAYADLADRLKAVLALLNDSEVPSDQPS